MFDFLKRFVLAWKLARNPDALKVLWVEVKARETAQQIREDALKSAKVAVTELVPDDRHAHRKDLDVTLTFECAQVMTPEEADQILEESRLENKPPLTGIQFSRVTELGNRVAFVEHNEKRYQEKFEG